MVAYGHSLKENGDEKATSVEAAEAELKAMEAKVSQLSATSARLAVERLG